MRVHLHVSVPLLKAHELIYQLSVLSVSVLELLLVLTQFTLFLKKLVVKLVDLKGELLVLFEQLSCVDSIVTNCAGLVVLINFYRSRVVVSLRRFQVVLVLKKR